MKTIQAYSFCPEEQLGKGHSSTVHRGIHSATGQPVAIKVIEMDKLEDPINQMLLQQEVNALRALTHSQHVLRLHDVYTTRNNTYIVTELCEGDLAGVLKEKRQMNYYEAVEVLRQLVEGYRDIYHAGYLHRDIKPANILHQGGKYKFADFGFAIPAQQTHLHAHYNVGSPIYMPPQALKNNAYSLSCDLWAIGVMFYLMLKGNLPWRAISQKVLYHKILAQPIDTISQGLPSAARQFLSKVLHQDPSQRLTVDLMLEWPNHLKAAPVQIRKNMTLSAGPECRTRLIQPLRQVNLNCNTGSPCLPSGKVIYSPLLNKSLKQTQRSLVNSQRLSFTQLRPKEVINDKKQESKSQQDAFKEAQNFCNNSINYVRFLHRILKFMSNCSTLDLNHLKHAISALMFQQMCKIKLALQTGEHAGVKDWGEFVSSSKGQLLHKKLIKCQAKYKMLHQCQLEMQKLTGNDLFTNIREIMGRLQGQYKSLWVVLADYLTTLYLLLHLREKYSPAQFMRMSKMELIMEGNPYSANAQHLDRLKRKILLIRP